jgi:hypothetical protein
MCSTPQAVFLITACFDVAQAALEMSFAMAKGTSGRLAEETHLSVNLGKSLLLYDLKDSDNPLELAFQSK